MSMVGFPLLLIPLAVYNIIVILMPDVALTAPLVKLTLVSGVEWPLTLGDVLLALGIVLLLFEVIKGARPGAKYLTDHLLSLMISGGAIAEFLLWPRFGTSTYFLLALLSLADFLSGVTLRVRRGVPVTAAVSRRAPGKPEIVSESQFDPAPAPAPVVVAPAPPPAPAPVAAPVEPTEPVILHPSPDVPSPQLQPGDGTSHTPEPPQR
jgi:hypothetical protein